MMSREKIVFRVWINLIIAFLSLYGWTIITQNPGYTYFYAFGWWFVIIAPILLPMATIFGFVLAGYWKRALDTLDNKI